MPLDEEGIKFTIDTSQAQDNVAKLRAEIERLNNRLETEKEFFRDNVQTQAQYIEASTKLKDSLREKTRLLEEVVGKEEVGTGFAGLSSNVLKAERAFSALATGHGLARAAPMLESVAAALGGPAGAATMFVALEMGIRLLGPTLEGLLKSIDPGKVAELTEEIKKAIAAAEALEATPTMAAKTTASAVSKAISERGAPLIEAQVEQGLGDIKGFMTPEERAKVEHLERYKAAGSPGGPLLGLEEEVRGITERAHAARSQQAKAFVGQLPTDRGTRDTLRQMAAAQPGLFGRGFITELGLAEPEAQAEQRQIVAGETMAGKEMQTRRDEIKATIKAVNEATKEANQRQKQWEQGTALQANVINQMEAEEVNAANKAAQFTREAQERAKREAVKAAHEAARAARENTPDHRLRAMEEAIKQQVTQAAMANAPADFTPQMVGEWVRQALKDLPMQGGNMQAALQQALMEIRFHLMHQAEMQAAQWNGMMGGGMGMFNPTVLAR